jgi:hypothetical protein
MRKLLFGQSLFVTILLIVLVAPTTRAFLPDTTRQQSETLNDILQRNARLALIKAKQNEDVCGLTRCNLFVAQVGELRGLPYIRDVLYPGKPSDAVGGVNKWRDVNTMYTFIDKAVKNPDQTGWRRLDADQAQQLANQGRFVLGVKNAQGHGHIVLVVPEDMNKSRTLAHGKGPWIRDAQHPHESVRASRAGNTDRWGLNGVTWAVWEFEDQNRLRFDDHHGNIVVEPRPSSAPPQRLNDALPPSATKRVSTLSHAELSRLQSLDEDHRTQPPPPPPPGSGGGGATTPLGGIDLGATAAWTTGSLPRLRALVIHPQTNVVVVAGEADLTVHGLTVRDLALALWLVFGPRPQDPKFSLDPADPANPRGEWLKAVYIPGDLRGRSFGAGLYEADFLLKQYAFGVTVDSAGKTHERSSAVVEFKSVAQLLYEDQGRRPHEAQWARYWIVPERMHLKRAEDTLYFDDVKMRVRARRQVPDPTSPSGLRDIDADEQALEMRWANLFTQHYDQIAAESPAFARVKELAKAVALAKWLKQEGVRVDLDWIVQQLNTDATKTVDKVGALSVSWKKEEQQPFTTANGTGIRTIRHELHLFGGVDLSVTPTFTRDEGVARSVREAVRAQLSGHPNRTVFTINQKGRALQAIVLPILRPGETVRRTE